MLRAGVLIAIALAVLGSGAAGASPAKPGCSRAAANAAIRAVKPRIPSPASGTMAVPPSMADELICFDFTGDGRTDLAVTVASGGTAGDIGWFVLRRTPTGWQVALSRGGYKVGLTRVGRDLVDSQPVYGKNDPNCCPTGGFDHQRWHWNGRRFVLARSWHDKSYSS